MSYDEAGQLQSQQGLWDTQDPRAVQLRLSAANNMDSDGLLPCPMHKLPSSPPHSQQAQCCMPSVPVRTSSSSTQRSDADRWQLNKL